MNPIYLSKSLNGESTFQLPSGPQNYSYEINLYVIITDDSDGSIQYNISTPVVVQTDQALISQMSNNILNNNVFIQSLGSNSLQSTASFINSFTSVFNSQQTNVIFFYFYRNN